MIVLSEHVDYWNHIGWKDPYSSHFFSERQSAYGDRFHLESVYTPQMIVDGTAEFTGSDTARANQVFAQTVKSSKVAICLSSLSLQPDRTIQVRIETDRLPASNRAEIYVALALNHAQSHVTGGENDGRTLTHVAVARSLVKVGTVNGGEAFAQDVHLKLDPATDPRNLRVIVFMQEPGQGKVFGAAEKSLSQ